VSLQFNPDVVVGCWSLVHGLAMLVIDGLLAETDPDPLTGLVPRAVEAILARIVSPAANSLVMRAGGWSPSLWCFVDLGSPLCLTQ
jgi:hypothetical protein